MMSPAPWITLRRTTPFTLSGPAIEHLADPSAVEKKKGSSGNGNDSEVPSSWD
jgi:hypothetical protein